MAHYGYRMVVWQVVTVEYAAAIFKLEDGGSRFLRNVSACVCVCVCVCVYVCNYRRHTAVGRRFRTIHMIVMCNALGSVCVGDSSLVITTLVANGTVR